MPHSTAAARHGSVRGSRRRAIRMPPNATTAGMKSHAAPRPSSPARYLAGPLFSATVGAPPTVDVVFVVDAAGGGVHPGCWSTFPLRRSAPLYRNTWPNTELLQ